MNSADKFDLIVIGGGPAGCTAARAAAELGANTVLLEKDRDFGIPVRCAEMLIEVEELNDFIPPDDKWIDNTGDKARLVAPDGTAVDVRLNQKWAVLNRKVFDFELARRAADTGVLVRNRCCATGMKRENGSNIVEYECWGDSYRVQAPVVICADGVESRAGRWAGLKTHLSLADIGLCMQYVVHHPEVADDRIEVYFGKDIAPGGYAWIVPKGGRTANVGLGILGRYGNSRSPKLYLDDFLDRRLPGASRLSWAAGAVPLSRVSKHIVADGVMLAGDAARQSDPVSGGGIIWGMRGGSLAGKTAAEALKMEDFSARTLNRYAKAWNAQIGKEHSRKYTAKRFALKLTDDILNRTAEILNQIPPAERTRNRIIQTIIQKGSGLTMEVAKVFLTNRWTGEGEYKR